MDKVSITMTMYDEFAESTSVDKTYDFGGSRSEEEADCICSMLEGFLRATEFARVCDDYDIQLVPKRDCGCKYCI